MRLINGGRSGDTAHGGLNRFDRDILSFKADRAFLMFGMNDINRNSWKSAEPSEKEAAARKKKRIHIRQETRAGEDGVRMLSFDIEFRCKERRFEK